MKREKSEEGKVGVKKKAGRRALKGGCAEVQDKQDGGLRCLWWWGSRMKR